MVAKLSCRTYPKRTSSIWPLGKSIGSKVVESCWRQSWTIDQCQRLLKEQHQEIFKKMIHRPVMSLYPTQDRLGGELLQRQTWRIDVHIPVPTPWADKPDHGLRQVPFLPPSRRKQRPQYTILERSQQLPNLWRSRADSSCVEKCLDDEQVE